jgi:transposase-like protein
VPWLHPTFFQFYWFRFREAVPITNNRALFPSDDVVFKLLYLALTNAALNWTMPIKNWKQALQQFAVFFPGRIPLADI